MHAVAGIVSDRQFVWSRFLLVGTYVGINLSKCKKNVYKHYYIKFPGSIYLLWYVRDTAWTHKKKYILKYYNIF